MKQKRRREEKTTGERMNVDIHIHKRNQPHGEWMRTAKQTKPQTTDTCVSFDTLSAYEEPENIIT